MIINSSNIEYRYLNRQISSAEGDITINNCLGQRFIGASRSCGTLTINGIPGNALGAYLDGASIIVNGNAQDATGDTMNSGRIVVHGSCGDAAGYAMRGGEIFIKGDVGYRAGIHMKAYSDKKPVMVIGGRCGSFLGEYQAGGLIIVLGLGCKDDEILGNFCGTGMHGGKIIIRANELTAKFPRQVVISRSTESDMNEISPYIDTFSELFYTDTKEIYSKGFYTLTPNTVNPYKQLYVQN